TRQAGCPSAAKSERSGRSTRPAPRVAAQVTSESVQSCLRSAAARPHFITWLNAQSAERLPVLRATSSSKCQCIPSRTRAITTSSIAADNEEYLRVVFVGAGFPVDTHVTLYVIASVPKKSASERVTAEVKLVAPEV